MFFLNIEPNVTPKPASASREWERKLATRLLLRRTNRPIEFLDRLFERHGWCRECRCQFVGIVRLFALLLVALLFVPSLFVAPPAPRGHTERSSQRQDQDCGHDEAADHQHHGPMLIALVTQRPNEGR